MTTCGSRKMFNQDFVRFSYKKKIVLKTFLHQLFNSVNCKTEFFVRILIVAVVLEIGKKIGSC